jgi:Na+/glutamate symporter
MNNEISQVIEIIGGLESRINSYWNFYVVVVLAIIGWLMSSRVPFTSSQGIVLTIAVGLFFTANFLILRASTKRVVAFEDELNCLSANHDFQSIELKKELSRPTLRRRLSASYLLHAIVDISVIYAIWSKLY